MKSAYLGELFDLVKCRANLVLVPHSSSPVFVSSSGPSFRTYCVYYEEAGVSATQTNRSLMADRGIVACRVYTEHNWSMRVNIGRHSSQSSSAPGWGLAQNLLTRWVGRSSPLMGWDRRGGKEGRRERVCVWGGGGGGPGGQAAESLTERAVEELEEGENNGGYIINHLAGHPRRCGTGC
jgi:hypothetical protein